MRQSQLFTKTRKDVSKSEEATNARILLKAGYIDQLMAGVYTYLPLGYRVIRNIERIVREEMNAIGGQEILMPALHPKSVWEETGRWDTIDVLYRFTTHYTGMEVALGSTHEEIVTPTAKKFVASYKDLPFATYQIQTKFRDEKRAKSGVLRGREFIMKDLYSFHTSEEDLDAYYEKAIEAYHRVYKRLGIGSTTYKTYASGGTFSKYSHEFQTLSPVGEDTVYVCHDCKIGVNEEIIHEMDGCPECGAKLEQTTAIEAGNIFKLKTKFSDSFGLSFTDKDGTEKPVYMGCYGIGISRAMGVITEFFAEGDSKMTWPEEVAPFKVHILALNTDKEDVMNTAEKLYQDLSSTGTEVLYDDRDERPGSKFSDADLIGIPHRVVVSSRSLEQGGVEYNGEVISLPDLLTKLSA